MGLYRHSPNTPSWHGAQLKMQRDNFTFYLYHKLEQQKKLRLANKSFFCISRTWALSMHPTCISAVAMFTATHLANPVDDKCFQRWYNQFAESGSVKKRELKRNSATSDNTIDQWYSTIFPPVPLETLFHSTLYPQSCWCIIQVIHNYI
jgi:hypothetical protein